MAVLGVVTQQQLMRAEVGHSAWQQLAPVNRQRDAERRSGSVQRLAACGPAGCQNPTAGFLALKAHSRLRSWNSNSMASPTRRTRIEEVGIQILAHTRSQAQPQVPRQLVAGRSQSSVLAFGWRGTQGERRRGLHGSCCPGVVGKNGTSGHAKRFMRANASGVPSESGVGVADDDQAELSLGSQEGSNVAGDNSATVAVVSNRSSEAGDRSDAGFEGSADARDTAFPSAAPPDSLKEAGAEKPAATARRRRGSSSSGGGGLSPSMTVAAAAGLPSDLLMVAGVGPRNLAKLQASGIADVATLVQRYRDKAEAVAEASGGAGVQRMVEHLRKDVGIVRKDHATLITTFAKLRVDAEDGRMDEQPGSTDGGDDATNDDGVAGADEGADPGRAKGGSNRRLTFCVEGNISVGKTTFLRRIAGEGAGVLELQDLVEIVPEPIEQWQNVGGGPAPGQKGQNLLEEFYREPRRYAYTFQNYVFVTRMMQAWNTEGGVRPIRLIERSVFSDRMVFVRAVHEAKWMDDLELNVYDSWFDPFVSSLPGLVPDGFIYLRAQPATCHERMQRRARGEEKGVSLDYLVGLHEKHEQWLLPARPAGWEAEDGAAGGAGVGGGRGAAAAPVGGRISVVDNWPDAGAAVGQRVPDSISGRVFALRGNHLHRTLQNVPALILDCDEHIDFNRDHVAKSLYAEQILAFFNYVGKLKAEGKQGKNREASTRDSSRLIIPSGPPLQLPHGVQFDPHSLIRGGS